MKNVFLLVGLMFCLVLMISCGSNDTKTETKPADQVQTEVETAVEETADEGATVETAVASFESIKEEYIGTAKETVTGWNDKVDAVADKVAALPAVAQTPLLDPLKTLVEKKDNLNSSFDELSNAPEDKYEDAKSGFESKLGEITAPYENVISLFKN